MKKRRATPFSLAGFGKYGKLLADHSVIITIALGLFALIYCVYSIQLIFDLPSDDAYRDEKMRANSVLSFDQQTIEHVKQLRTSDQEAVPLPSGKINPFVQ